MNIWAKNSTNLRLLVVSAIITFSGLFSDRALSDDAPDDHSRTREYYRRMGLWIVPATIAYRSGFALLATGSNIVAVHARNGASDFPEHSLLQPSSNPETAPLFAAMPFGCLGLPMKKGVAVGMNLEPLQEVTHLPISAFAAMPYLRQHIIRLDPAEGRIDVLNDVEGIANDVQLKIEWVNELPRVPVNLPVLGHRTLVLETGASQVLTLGPERVQTLERMGHIVKVGSRSQGVKFNLNNSSKLNLTEQIYVLRWLEFGGVRFENIPVEVQDKEKIGLGLLRYFRTTLNFPNDRIHLEPLTRDRSAQVPLVAVGMNLSFHDSDHLMVESVTAGYPARSNGIEVGDRVLSIDGHVPTDLSRYEIKDILSESGKTVPFDLQRGDRRFHVDLKLEHPFPWPPQWKPELPEFDPIAESENQSTQ